MTLYGQLAVGYIHRSVLTQFDDYMHAVAYMNYPNCNQKEGLAKSSRMHYCKLKRTIFSLRSVRVFFLILFASDRPRSLKK